MNREIKDSGIKWVGKVPRNWKIHRFKNILQNRNLKNKPKVTDTILSLTKDRGVIPYSEKGDVGNRSKEDITKYNLAFPEDIVMNSMNVIIGSVNISKYTGAVSPVYYVFYPKNKNINIYFYNMLFQTREFQNSLKGIGNGILEHRMRIPLNKLNNIRLPLPEYKEQLKIVDFLDKAIININNIITQTYHSIEELKKYKQSLITEAVTKGLDSTVEMKDSGIEPMVNVPKHWKINKIKYLFELYGGLNITKKNLIDTGIPVINYGEIHSKYGFHFDLRYDVVQKVDSHYLEYKNSLINQGDFIFADTSEDIEGSGNFTCYLNEEMCFAGSHTIILKSKKFINYFYFSYLFESLLFRSQIQKKVEGIKVYSITQRILKSLILFEPPAEEQQQIVEYLDDKVSTIDNLIKDKTKVIEELENYKKSLIYEYVTGKKEV
ncbi:MULTISPECIES: restriction endonuclease subunit S [unclassified Staphylococcus]|uniref:restriction endonuclease subunit S n=1 Tax=unclassified Staphylococcus TaxID=91994 RepID=UPI0008A3EC37|nr:MULTISPECIES: restriction endonuclease subunit S [unclassified Staphylococcus]OFS52189.1 hypothetical protein HMPREF2862_11520 [Staphylococcus sp. HMSC065C09]OHQ10738.1 hypothetical protein HMPREF2664_10270 [Staphylococcus sp. HMSC064E03]OLF65621.1 hypothetical protein BB045_10890 [Staphylococcus sp. MB377]